MGSLQEDKDPIHHLIQKNGKTKLFSEATGTLRDELACFKKKEKATAVTDSKQGRGSECPKRHLQCVEAPDPTVVHVLIASQIQEYPFVCIP